MRNLTAPLRVCVMTVFGRGCCGGALLSRSADYHTAELPFVFDHQYPALLNTFSAKDKEMASYFGVYWPSLGPLASYVAFGVHYAVLACESTCECKG